MLCPRECGVDRENGEVGFCGVTGGKVSVAHYMLHRWEEPCISGSGGAGAVFFAGCSLRCEFCQNRKISRGDVNPRGNGGLMDENELAALFLKLQADGADDLDLVTPTHYAPQIIAALTAAKRDGLTIPAIWNSSGYEKPETIRALRGAVEVFLPDFKYYSDELAVMFSHAPRYFELASAALREMTALAGEPRYNSHGIITGGVIVRVLVLPGHTDDTMKLLHWLHREYGDGIVISIMGQYTPPASIAFPELSRQLTQPEYDEVVDFADEIGITNAYTQELTSISESFIPDF